VSGRGMIICSGTVAMVRGVRMPPGCGVVVMGIGGVTTLHFQEMGKLEPPPLPTRGYVELFGGVLENGMQRRQSAMSHSYEDNA
jgi:hypothetical protein